MRALYLNRTYRILKNDDFFMFWGELSFMNTFVALRNMNMFSKRKIIKINPPFIQENIQVRAGKCAHYILHRIYRILKNKDYFMFFWKFMVMNTFIALRYRHVFKAKNAQNESNFQSLTIVSFLHDNLINKLMLTYTFQNIFMTYSNSI